MSLEQLKQAVAESNVAEVAKRIGVDRSTLSLIVRDKYPASPDKVLHKFALASDIVNCPYAGKTLTQSDCRTRHTAPRPFGGGSKMAWWDACQDCAFNSLRLNHE